MSEARVTEPDRRVGPQTFWLRPGVVTGLAALAIGAGWVLDVRGDGLSARDWFVAAVLGLAAIAAVAGAAAALPAGRAAALAWAAASMISVGALSLGSIGIPLLAAGAIAAWAMVGELGYGADRRVVTVVAAVLLTAFAVVFMGVLLTR